MLKDYPPFQANDFEYLRGRILILLPENDIFKKEDQKRFADLFRKLDAEIRTVPGGHVGFIVQAERYLDIFSELYTAHSVPDTGYLRLKVLELLHILTRLKNREDVQQTEYFNQHQVECVKQVAALLTQELTVRRTIEQLAQEVGLSPTALKSCFKGIYGSSVYAYQKEYRLQLAQKLLLETDCTVAEIAHRVGYENPNKFSSAFREAAGMTPTEYRKMRPIG